MKVNTTDSNSTNDTQTEEDPTVHIDLNGEDISTNTEESKNEEAAKDDVEGGEEAAAEAGEDEL